MRPPWPVPLHVLLLAGGAYAAFAASMSYWFTRTTGLSRWTMSPAGPAVAFWNLLGVNLATWCGWALLAAVVFSLGHRVRFGPERWGRALAFHAAASVAITTAHITLVSSARVMLQTLWGLHPSWWLSWQEAFFRTIDMELPVYWALLALQFAVNYHREARAREVSAATLETRLVEAQLEALQNQLHPHFLFNTLHAIAALLHREPDKAEEMIERLSDLLRVTLRRSDGHVIPLAAELEHLRAYLDIEQVHFGDRLAIDYRVDGTVAHALVPRLVLQPLAENAVRHGLEPRAGCGRLTIAARRCGDRLVLEVRDTGRGMTPPSLAALNEGVGLSTTRARLDKLYHGDASLGFTQNPGGGVVVTVSIPYRSTPAARQHRFLTA